MPVIEKKNNSSHPKTEQRRILILLAHPSLDRSEVNRPLADAAADIDGVTLIDLYAEYPDFQIDIDKEQERLLSHDVIIFQHPLYWYSTPAILKEWQDLVLEYGFAYGVKGTALHGKFLLNAISAGSLEETYCTEGYNQFTIRELLRPLEQTAILCGMIYLAPFTLFGARDAVEEGRLETHIADWLRVLIALRDDRINIDKARDVYKLNDDLSTVIREN